MTTASAEPKGIARLQMEEEQLISESLLKRALRRLWHDRLTMTAIGVIAILAILSIGAPFISEQILNTDYSRVDMAATFLKPGEQGHILGTDDLGRDHLARLLWGGQVSLGIGFTAAILSITIGVSIGIFTGYYGGIVDDLIMWFITTINSIPSLFLLLIFAALFDPGPLGLILVLGFLGWTGTTRLVRGETFSLREREFVISARAAGATDLRIMFVHILPNLISIVVVTLAIDIGVLILVESGLSYLGLGVPPPTPSWGNMLTDSQSFINRAPHLVILPGLLITITVLCLYVIGDGIRDAFDPTIVD